MAPAPRTAANRRFALSCGQVKIPINFMFGPKHFTSQKQLTVLPLLLTCAHHHQSKKMEEEAVATVTEEVPSDEKKADDEAAKAATEPKTDAEDAPAPPAAGDATADRRKPVVTMAVSPRHTPPDRL